MRSFRTLTRSAARPLLLPTAMFLAVGLVFAIYTYLFEAIVWPHYRVDNTALILKPEGVPMFVDSNAGEVFNSPKIHKRVMYLNRRTVVYRQRIDGDWSHIAVYGWIWAASISPATGSARKLANALQQENIRAQSQGAIIAQFFSSAELEALAPGEDTRWQFCRIFGWVRNDVLHPTAPRRMWPAMTPIFTVITRDGGDTYERQRHQYIYENTAMLAGVMATLVLSTVGFAIRLLRGGKFISRDTYNQTHIGSGDNVTGSKMKNSNDR